MTSSTDRPAPRERPDPAAFLARTVESTRRRFESRATLLGFGAYLERVADEPAVHLRDAARYARDAIAWFGAETVDRPYGQLTRHRIFDAAFDDGRDPVIGQETVQQAVVGLLTDFVRAGRVNRLVLLGGPNGSAKSSFVACVMRGLEHYSGLPEGALYTFNWVFPSARLEKSGIGFGSPRSVDELTTFAHLKEGDVDARIRCETRDHPLLLLPRDERRAFLRSIIGDDAPLPASLTEGELSPKAREIRDALLKAYQGDLGEVLKHVQVERFYISRRYRQAAVTVDPQMRVDAGVRQVTADRSMSSLPPSLHNLALFEPVGDLVDANRGVVEYNDLLKRNPEAFKYLLSTCETGAVRLETMVLHLDAVLLGTCNAGRLTAFKGSPDFASFKARIELVTMPYLLDYRLESRIYDDLLKGLSRDLPIGPHVAEALGLWAVMCRLERPLPDESRPAAVQAVIDGMNPLDKARLYAEGRVPQGAPRDVANTLVGLIPALYRERANDELYEGRRGPSPRALKGLLFSAARSAKGCLTTVGLLDALGDMIEETAVYPWLAIEPDGMWHHPGKAIDLMRGWYLDRVEDELHQAMGLVDKTATAEMMRRYIDHAVHFVRGEKRINPHTGRAEEPDLRLMQDVEKRLRVAQDGGADFRQGVVQRIAVWRMEHSEGELDYGVIFREHINRLNDSFYQEQRKQSGRFRRELLSYLVGDGTRLEPEALARVERAVASLEQDFGYDRQCAVEVIGFLFRQRAETAE